MLLKNIRFLVGSSIKENVDLGISRGQLCEPDKTGEVLDCSDYIAMPGLVNNHTHAAMTLFRGWAENLELSKWLEKIWSVEEKLKPKHVYYGTLLAAIEMLKTGTTVFNDMYFYPEQVKKAAQEIGIRTFAAEPVFDENVDEIKPNLDILGPHSIYTCSKETLLKVKDLANDKKIHIHISETREEVDRCIKQTGKRPTEYLEDLGFLSSNLIAAHCGWLSKKECQLLNKYKVTSVHCPTSNMKLSTQAKFPMNQLENITIGTDGAASNNSLNMLQETKQAALLQKHLGKHPKIEQLFRAATINGAKSLGLDYSLELGADADLVLIDINNPELQPLNKNRLLAHLIYSFSGPADSVIVGGKVVLKNQKLTNINEQKIYQKVEAARKGLCK